MNQLLLTVRRLGVRLTADRKQFAVLCTLTAIALLFWTRLIVIKRIPRTALADQEVHEVASASDADDAAGERPVIEVILPERPGRDPFSIDRTLFPVTAIEEESQEIDSWVDADASVASMRLEASMPPALAVIDGATRRRNDTVHGSDGLSFTIAEIRPKSVVLERADARFVLRMD